MLKSKQSALDVLPLLAPDEITSLMWALGLRAEVHPLHFCHVVVLGLASWTPGTGGRYAREVEQALGEERCRELAPVFRSRAQAYSNTAGWSRKRWAAATAADNLVWIRGKVKHSVHFFCEWELRSALAEWDEWLQAAQVDPDVASFVVRVRDAVRKLPPDLAAVMEERFFSGGRKSQAETALALGVCERTVRNREKQAVAYVVADAMWCAYHTFLKAWIALQQISHAHAGSGVHLRGTHLVKGARRGGARKGLDSLPDDRLR